MPLLVRAGFLSPQGSATFDCFGDSEKVGFYASMHQSLISEKNGTTMFELGIATKSELDEFYEAFGQWAKEPGAFVAICYCEALAWKE